jgi:hypothetical protein
MSVIGERAPKTVLENRFASEGTIQECVKTAENGGSFTFCLRKAFMLRGSRVLVIAGVCIYFQIIMPIFKIYVRILPNFNHKQKTLLTGIKQ